MKWLRKTFTVKNQGGIHARVAVKLAELAGGYQVELKIEQPGQSIACEAILEVLSLALVYDSKVTLIARGNNALEALDAAGLVLAGEEGA